MRKIFLIGAILSFAIMFIACSNATAQSRLEEEVNEIQQKLPISLGETGEIVDVAYDITDNVVIYSMAINDDYLFNLKMDIDIERLNHLSSENIIYASHGLECIDFMNLIVDAGASLKYNYRTKIIGTSETYSSELSSQTLKDRLSSKKILSFNSKESRNELLDDIQLFNEELPDYFDDGILMKSVKLETDNVVFLIELSTRYSFADVDDFVLIRAFLETVEPMRKLLFDCNYGVIIRLQLSTGECKDIVISPFEVYTFG